MPYRRRVSAKRNSTFRRTKLRRRTRARRYYRKRGQKLRRQWKNPISQSSMVRFIYSDDGFSATLTAGNNYNSYYVFRGNSPYDPDYTGVGVQPYGYDQYAAVYAAYNCPASKITVNYFITSESASQVKAFLIPSRSPNPTYHDPSDMSVMPFSRWKSIDKEGGQTRRNWMKSYCSSKKIYRLANPGTANYGSSINDNPSYLWYWIIAFDNSSVAEEVVIKFDVRIKYYTKLSRYDSINES